MWAREELFHMFAGMNDDDGNQFLRTCIDFSRPKNQSSVGETRTKKRVEYIIPIMVSDHSSFGEYIIIFLLNCYICNITPS